MKIIQSRNKREGYYAGYYPAHFYFKMWVDGQYVPCIKRGKHCRSFCLRWKVMTRNPTLTELLNKA